MSLKEEAGKGFFWVTIERFGQQFLSAVTFIILARLLTPEDFGWIGMLMIFFAISQSFIDSGMGQALIRETEISDQDRSTVFWLNLFLSVLFYIIIFFSAPIIAEFYDEPILRDLSRFMGLTIIFNGVAIVQRSELTQQLKFKEQTLAQVPAILVSSVLAIIMAYGGYGVWALATQYVLVAFFSSSLLWLITPAKIFISWSKESFIRLFSFGYKLLLSGLLDTTYNHIYKLIIGKFFMTATLGFYSQAQKLQELAGQSLIGIIQKVSYPLLAKANGDLRNLKRGYRQVIKCSSFIIFPCMLLLIIFAKPFMTYVLGEQWTPAAPFLQLLGLSGILYHLHAVNLNILKVLGRSDLFLRLEILKKLNITLAILIGIQFGVFGLLIGQVISSYVALFINTYFTAKLLNYSFWEQAKDVLSVLLLSLPMVFIILTIEFLIPASSLSLLLFYFCLSAAIYILSNLIYRTDVTKMILSFITPYLSIKFKNILQL